VSKGLLVCQVCGEEKQEYSKGLCTQCYKKELARQRTGTCQICGREKPLDRKGHCGACRERLRVKPQGECSRCRQWREIKGHGMCAVCVTAEYRERTGYQGPVRKCDTCGEETPIKARNMCNRCYIQWRIEQNPEHFRELKKNYVAQNRERTLDTQKKWRDEHKEHIAEEWKLYYQKNRKRLDHNRKIKYHKHREANAAHSRIIRYQKLANGEIIIQYAARDPQEIMTSRLKQIPEFKRPLVDEFLNGVYKDRAYNTKILFLSNLIRLIEHLDYYYPDIVNGSWNMLNLTIIDECQVHTGILKDSVRVFFHWLYVRKGTNQNLAKAIPTQILRMGKKRMARSTLRELYLRWTSGNVLLVEKIAGMLIMFYGFTNKELRSLKKKDISNGILQYRGENIELEPLLKQYIQEYINWRNDYYQGLNDSNEFFFISRMSIFSGKIVSVEYFSKLFRKNGLPSPSAIRKSMIYLHKDDFGFDPFAISAVFGISPRGAARYWE
jgi:hypothetical protein